MKNINISINKLKEKYNIFFENKKNITSESIRKTVNSFSDYAKKNNLDNMFLDLDKSTKNIIYKTNILPEFVKIGEILSENINNKIPLLLPFSKNNATVFFIDETNSEEIHKLFQTIAIRLMITVAPNIAEYYLIDTEFNKNFSKLHQIKNREVININKIEDKNGIEQTINKLAENTSNAIQSYLTKYSNIIEYNKANSLAKTYRFVFITNFPNDFNDETIKKLHKLIKDKNANKAGIYFFISYNDKIKHKDINEITKITTNIYKEQNKYIIKNENIVNLTNNNCSLLIDAHFPKVIDNIIKALNKIKKPKVDITFEKELDELIRNEKIWKKDASFGIRIPVGYISDKEKHYFILDKEYIDDNIDRDRDYHVLIGGITGKGKSVFIHNIIINTAMYYSPFEVQFYLFDCKRGLEFKRYSKLPHTKVNVLSNDIKFIKKALQFITQDEMKKRSELFGNSGDCSNIEEYNNEQTKNKMPRIIIIIDEFQLLLEPQHNRNNNFGGLLINIAEQGRAYGIHLILSSQGVGKLTFNKDQFTRRYAFKLSKTESRYFLGNEKAANLKNIGAAIMNNSSREKNSDANIYFKGAMLENNKKDFYIKSLIEAFEKKYPNQKIKKFISDGKTTANLNKNEKFITEIINNSFVRNNRKCKIYIGEPELSNEHLYFEIEKLRYSQLVGQKNS